MTMIEAVQAIQKDPSMWARAVEWAGWRTALYCKGDRLFRFNSPVYGFGHDLCVIGTVRFVTGEWEVVAPERVTSGG